MFTTTAFAEVVSKSGYDQAKDAMKYTADSLTSKLSNYTADLSFVTKDNGNIIISENSVNKYDLKSNSCENTSTRINGKNKDESLFYRDKNNYISYNSTDGIYHVVEQNSNDDGFWVKNLFKQKEAGDLEKIADAFVGNLKDNVLVSQNSDGSKEFSGSISEAQIPALANAIISFQLKQRFGSYRNPNDQSTMPRITEDVFVKEVTGKMVVDKNGLIQSVLGTGILHGKDEKGTEHNITFELLAKVSNVNSTVVNKPDLSGKKVQKSVGRGKDSVTNPGMYVGTYKNNIVIEKDGKFQKIGERILEIEQIDTKTISGRYHEQYNKGYEDYSANAKDFKFNAKFNQFPYDANFDVPAASGKSVQGNISLNIMNAVVYFNMNQPPQEGNMRFDSNFTRVFD